jgi:Zn-dependent M28 family amino/carboxypeptidase
MFVIHMPGVSYQGNLSPLSPAQIQLRDRLHTHINMLAGTIGERNLDRYPALETAATYIWTQFETIGYAPAAQVFEAWGKEVKNLEVTKKGRDLAEEIVVVGAHYDSVRGSPGANDNGTGVAAVLELARLLSNRRVDRTVRFVTFVNEEPPYFYSDAMGSRRYVSRSASRGEHITAMLSLETIGYYSSKENSQLYPFPFALFYPRQGNFIGFVGNLRSRHLVRKAIGSFRTYAKFPSEGVAAPGWITGIGWSDHWSFWQAGYPAIMVTDTALFRYPQYHTSQDQPKFIDYDNLARVVDGLAGVIADLAMNNSR